MEENIRTRIEKRKEQISDKLNLSSIKFPRPLQIVKDCYLILDSAQIYFNLFSFKDNILSGIRILATVKNPNPLVFSTIVQKINLFDLVYLIAYFQEYIETIKKGIPFTSDLFTVYNPDKRHIFDLQILSENLTSNNESSLNLYFKLNVTNWGEESNKYLDIKSSTNFKNIYDFISTIQEFIVEAYLADNLLFNQNLTNNLSSSEIIARSFDIRPKTNSQDKDKICLIMHRDYDLPINKCKGIETSEQNISLILIQASVEAIAKIIRQIKPLDVWIPDAYANQIEIYSDSFLVFQFQGNLWSIIYEPDVLSRQIFLTDEDVSRISESLNTDAIVYHNSDTCGTKAYKFFRKGLLLEKLYSMEGKETEFESQYRQIEIQDIENGNFLMSNFIQDRGVYIPYICEHKYFIEGKKRILQIKNLLKSEVTRMDYLGKKRFKYNSFSNSVLINRKTI